MNEITARIGKATAFIALIWLGLACLVWGGARYSRFGVDSLVLVLFAAAAASWGITGVFIAYDIHKPRR